MARLGRSQPFPPHLSSQWFVQFPLTTVANAGVAAAVGSAGNGAITVTPGNGTASGTGVATNGIPPGAFLFVSANSTGQALTPGLTVTVAGSGTPANTNSGDIIITVSGITPVAVSTGAAYNAIPSGSAQSGGTITVNALSATAVAVAYHIAFEVIADPGTQLTATALNPKILIFQRTRGVAIAHGHALGIDNPSRGIGAVEVTFETLSTVTFGRPTTGPMDDEILWDDNDTVDWDSGEPVLWDDRFIEDDLFWDSGERIVWDSLDPIVWDN